MHRTLFLATLGLAAVVPAADALAAPYGSRTLRSGSAGSDVRVLQRYLDRAGQETTADGEFGPATKASLQAFEETEGRAVNGIATRSDQRLVRKRAAEDPVDSSETYTEPTAEGSVGPDGLAVPPAGAPEEVVAIIEAGNKIARKPYKYGGGHGRWRDTGYDCSGSVSYALHGAGLLDSPLDSSAFASWGERGARRLGHDPDQPGPRLHGRRRAALRHERPQARLHALDRDHALAARLRRAPPRGPLGGLGDSLQMQGFLCRWVASPR